MKKPHSLRYLQFGAEWMNNQTADLLVRCDNCGHVAEFKKVVTLLEITLELNKTACEPDERES